MLLEKISDAYDARVLPGAEIARAQALRYEVFCREMGAQAEEAGIESDRFDAYATHFGVYFAGQLIGTTRIMGPEGAALAGGYYTETEFDLSALRAHKMRIAELGRSCIAPEHRSGLALAVLWSAIEVYVAEQGFDVLVGTASFAGCHLADHARGVSILFEEFAVDPSFAPVSKQVHILPKLGEVSRREALLEVPVLIKSYLRRGARIGQGVYLDQAFNTTDVCVVFDLGGAQK